MYYEEANIREYKRKDKEGVKRPYYQIRLKKKSKFNEVKPIALIDISEVKELESFLESNKIEEKEAELKQLKEENLQLKEEVNKLNGVAEDLASDVHKLKEEKTKLQQDLLNNKNFYEDKLEDLNTEKEESKRLLATITKLTSEKNEVEKENIFLKNRSLLNRILNKQYTKEDVEAIPEEVKSEAKPSEE